jgi:hypothetical protein
MATTPRDNFDFEEQRVRIVRAIEEVEKLSAESRKLTAEQLKLGAEQFKLMAEEAKFRKDTSLSPWVLLAQGLIAGAALLGSALALAKYLIG